ncbi:MAG: DUF4097 family beta strand repeat protein [Acidobacteria bacterium]|nr:DUF4097 family beta strand repeat protein [Acidobacteriota bacterium]
MKRPFRSLALLVTALALPLGARAERLERTFPATADTVVEVRNLNGQVIVHAWERPQVQVVALRRSLVVETHIEQGSNRIHVHTHLLQSSAPASERVVDYEIWAPASAGLQLQLETGAVDVENFTDDVNVETVAAAVRLRNLSGHTSVKTLNGSILVERCSGRLEATSISGSMHFLDSTYNRLVANTTSGDILYEGDLRRGGSYDFLNHEGAIELRLPPSASFELDARTVQGEVVNEHPLTPRSHGRVPQRSGLHSLLGTAHTGEAMIRATSFSGKIWMRKR